MSTHFNSSRLRKVSRQSKIKRKITKRSIKLLHLQNLIFLKLILTDATRDALMSKKKRLTKETVRTVIKRQLQKLKK